MESAVQAVGQSIAYGRQHHGQVTPNSQIICKGLVKSWL
nr:MAG TPA: hypothetical protein [Caudoviricetes sp.]